MVVKSEGSEETEFEFLFHACQWLGALAPFLRISESESLHAGEG